MSMKHCLTSLLTIMILLVSCQEKESEEPVREITEIKTEYSHYEIMDGEFLTINVIHSPEDLPAPEYDLTVADPEVLSDRTISELMIRGRNPGESQVTIIVKDKPSLKTTCLVTVKANVTGISLSRTAVEIYESEELVLIATVYPANATDKSVTWSVDNPEVVSVENGKVVAKTPGTAIVTVASTDGNYTATCQLSVLKVVEINEESAANEGVGENNGNW